MNRRALLVPLAIVLGITLAGVGTVAMASRNTAGTYTLYPVGNPVVTGTGVSSTWANQTLGDIASALTDSLSRSGYGPMQASLALVDGTVGAPGLSFANESSTGLFRIGSHDVGLAVNGVKQQEWTNSGVTVPTLTSNTLTAQDASTGTTGTVGLGNSGSRYVKYDGTNYQMPGAPLVNPTAFLGAARYFTGAGGSSVAPTAAVGSITLGTATHTGTGLWTIPITGLTSNALVFVTCTGGYSAWVGASPSSGSLLINAKTTATTWIDVDFAVFVLAL